MKSNCHSFSAFITMLWFLLVGVLPIGAGPLTNTVPIAKDLYFQLSKEFGPVTNCFPATEPISFRIESFITNKLANRNIFYRGFPEEHSFIFKLFDPDGKEVQKTALGRKWSMPPDEPETMRQAASLKGYRPPSVKHLFSADQMFEVSEKGDYEMEVSIRLWVQTTNSGTPNELEEYINPMIGTNCIFGVVTSPPVRVQITKE